MSTPEAAESSAHPDPFAAHFRRELLPEAGIRIILITELAEEQAQRIIAPIVGWFDAASRPVETRIVSLDPARNRLNKTVGLGLEGASLPLVLVSTATQPWSPAHLEPLLESIHSCDHVFGRRQSGLRVKVFRWIGSIWRKLVFAVPVLDVHSPCQLHRTEKLAAISLQSRSSFLDVEILAKATFMGHLLDEVDVPPLPGRVLCNGWWADLVEILKRPVFKRTDGVFSGPTEEAKSQVEGDDSPSAENQERRTDIEEASPFQQDSA
jgi:hypothetical protein